MLVRAKNSTAKLLLLTFALLILGETATRIARKGLPFDDSDFYRHPKPYVEFAGYPNGKYIPERPSPMGGNKEDAVEELNELGFRGPLPNRNKDDEIRIIMLGGSTVFAGAPLENSIAGQLQLLYRQNGNQKVHVYNWGVISFVSGQELSLLTHTVLEFNPDLVIVYDGGNDVHQPYNYDPRPGYPYNWLLYERGLARIRKGDSLVDLTLAAAMKSELLRLLLPIQLKKRAVDMDSLKNEIGYGSEEWRKQISSAYLRNIAKMCTVARGGNFKLALFLQPMLFFKSPLVGKEPQLIGSEEFQVFIKEVYKDIRSGLEGLIRKREGNGQCYFTDLSEVFSSYDKEVFWDFIHITNAGNEYVARELYGHLTRIGL